MILYSWKTVYEKSQRKFSRIIKILEYLTYQEIPDTKKDIDYTLIYTNWSGSSFLLNPEALLKNRDRYTKRDLLRYIGLASLRSYADYKMYRKITLDLVKCPLNQDTLKANRLLKIENDQIHFLWEEATVRRNLDGRI